MLYRSFIPVSKGVELDEVRTFRISQKRCHEILHDPVLFRRLNDHSRRVEITHHNVVAKITEAGIISVLHKNHRLLFGAPSPPKDRDGLSFLEETIDSL